MQEFAHAELFGLIAEIAATFIGFSLVIGLLQPDSKDAKIRLEAMRAVAELAMIGGLGALLALALNAFRLDSSLIWQITSGLTVVVWFSLHRLAAIRWTAAGFPWRKEPKLRFAGYFSFTGMLALSVNTILPMPYGGAILAVALILALGTSGFVFVVITFGSKDERAA